MENSVGSYLELSDWNKSLKSVFVLIMVSITDGRRMWSLWS